MSMTGSNIHRLWRRPDDLSEVIGGNHETPHCRSALDSWISGRRGLAARESSADLGGTARDQSQPELRAVAGWLGRRGGSDWHRCDGEGCQPDQGSGSANLAGYRLEGDAKDA